MLCQVLMKCMAVLEENSALLKERRPAETSEALLGMVACITYYLSRVGLLLTHTTVRQTSIVLNSNFNASSFL